MSLIRILERKQRIKRHEVDYSLSNLDFVTGFQNESQNCHSCEILMLVFQTLFIDINLLLPLLASLVSPGKTRYARASWWIYMYR